MELRHNARDNRAGGTTARASELTSLEGLRILIVDDESAVLEALREMLIHFKAETLAVHSANEAMIALEHFKPDVLVCDIGLPDEDGCSLMRKIRALGEARRGKIPALALTGHTGPEDIKRAIESGF